MEGRGEEGEEGRKSSRGIKVSRRRDHNIELKRI